MKPDFQGYATRYGIRCSDGRTIAEGAFKGINNKQLPLVWQHNHSDLKNVLGHCLVEERPDGLFVKGFFNDTERGREGKKQVEHGDLSALSIYATHLEETSDHVVHKGTLREISLVLSGANPGAKIEPVVIQHSDGFEESLDGEAVIYSETDALSHEDSEKGGERTVADVLEEMSDEQKSVVGYLIEQAVSDKDSEDDEESSDDPEKDIKHSDGEGSPNMKTTRNIFENNAVPADDKVNLEPEQIKTLIHEAEAGNTTLKNVVMAHAETGDMNYGVTNIDMLFPDAKALDNKPEFISRRMEWVSKVISGTRHTPFSRIKSLSADITHDEARAKGYIKGNMKKTEYFGIARRDTTPTTIYKKQKLDRDDIIDITDFDVVAWMKAEMRIMLEEEIARAVLIGDGREPDDEDKIREDKIRPIATDHDFYTHKVEIDASAKPEEIIEALVRARRYYKGSGSPTLFISNDLLIDMLLVKDQIGRRLYRTTEELKAAMGVGAIQELDLLDSTETSGTTIDGLKMILVNLKDYTIGADKGGQTTFFDDFDIDFNQYKYLYETRMSGALTRHKTAMAVWVKGKYTEDEAKGPKPKDHGASIITDRQQAAAEAEKARLKKLKTDMEAAAEE